MSRVEEILSSAAVEIGKTVAAVEGTATRVKEEGAKLVDAVVAQGKTYADQATRGFTFGNVISSADLSPLQEVCVRHALGISYSTRLYEDAQRWVPESNRAELLNSAVEKFRNTWARLNPGMDSPL